MPGKALQATERQYSRLLRAASAASGIKIRLSLFALSGIRRSGQGQQRVDKSYLPIHQLWNERLDGIIVTGTEPVTRDLAQEAYWSDLSRLVDWAGDNTSSAVWSCLAAHAAVLRADGIPRRALPEKLSGVFRSTKVAADALLTGIPDEWRIPHSRSNTLSEDDLAASGYRILTWSAEAGVDMFVKRSHNLSLFFQGHPEYSLDTLLLEYLRDIRRFLRRERDIYPSMPRNYFSQPAAERLTAFMERASADRREELMAQFPVALVASKLANAWQDAGAGIYRNWLRYLAAQPRRRESRLHRVAYS